MKVIIAGGGTAGHINPGIAIANYIKEKIPDSTIIFIGTKRGMETKLVPREGFTIKFIRVRGFKRKLSGDTVLAVKDLFHGLFEARKIIKEFKPDLVIGTGGYVCGPVLINASFMNIPTLIHEQNAYPGVTNRILSKFVKKVAISFKESEKYFKATDKIVLTGNPVRKEILKVNRYSAREKLGIPADKKIVVVMGGSLGALKINNTMVEMIKNSYSGNEFDIIFATGNSQYEGIASKLDGINKPGLNLMAYIFDAANVYAAADLIICRAGAITISELTAMGMPCIMIPSPYVTANHQEHNARALESQGAALVMLEKDLEEKSLYQKITEMLGNKEKLLEMSANSKRIGITNAVEKIFSIIQSLTK